MEDYSKGIKGRLSGISGVILIMSVKYLIPVF